LAYFKVRSQYLPRGNEESHRKLSQDSWPVQAEDRKGYLPY